MQSIEVKMILSFIMSFVISTVVCKIMAEPKKKPAKYKGYDEKTDKFYCPQCGREITQTLSFMEVCQFCKECY